ncbi:MAG: metallophosphoesterase family protein [Bacteroidetes bacterium]|nr:metallophosphoesterase family protein [Bacteroidota bacterium]
MGLIAIGDIHGCALTLDALLRELDPTPDDHLVFIGDYMDRGPDSKGVIERLILLKDKFQCTFLRGNHEELMLNFLDHGEYDLWAVNGGISTQQSYGIFGEGATIPEDHVAFVRATQFYLETEDFFFVHAGLHPGKTIAQNVAEGNVQVFLWERSHLQAEKLAWEKTVVCGHTPISAPLNTELLINIDTGCCFYTHAHLGRLTAVRLPEREFVSIPFMG